MARIYLAIFLRGGMKCRAIIWLSPEFGLRVSYFGMPTGVCPVGTSFGYFELRLQILNDKVTCHDYEV